MGEPDCCLSCKTAASATIGNRPLRIRTVGGVGGRREYPHASYPIETAFFLDLTVKSKKPVVVIGAMRPATAISADGPMNLLNAVKLAADSKAQGRGVLVALNDQISSGRDVTKSNTTNVATFKSPDLGYLGYIAGGKNYFLRNPAMRHTHQSEFDVSKLDKLPRSTSSTRTPATTASLPTPPSPRVRKGIVHAGSGNGSVHGQTEPALAEAVQKGIAVVLSSRTGSGVVCPNVEQYNKAGFIEGRTLNPQKARLLLQARSDEDERSEGNRPHVRGILILSRTRRHDAARRVKTS